MQFYCEHHENIRILHVSVTLPSAADDLTQLDIYDRKTLRLRHAFQSYSIALPASLTVIQLPTPVIDGSTWTYRLPASSIRPSSTNDIPLSTPDSLSSLQCTSCHSPLVKNTDMSWRLMPSENWAEMMDSWHCHRGVSDHHHHEIHDQYALPDHIVSAAERIRPRPGTGLIGSSYLLIHPSDMARNLKIGSKVSCSCGQVLGDADSVECKIEKSMVWDGSERVDALTYLVADMLALLESSSVHKFLLSDASGSAACTIWILTPDARITASTLCNTSPGKRVVKVMYREATAEDAQEQEMEHVTSTPANLKHLRATLTAHGAIMGAQGMGHWSTSFLEKYEHIQEHT